MTSSNSKYALTSDHSNLVSLLQGSGVVALGLSARIFLTFFTEVAAARLLLPERYGLITWGLFLSNIICMISGLGLNTAIRRFVPIYQSQNDLSSVRGAILFSASVSTAGGVIGGLLLLLGAQWLSHSVIGDAREHIILLTFIFLIPSWNLQKAMLAVFGGFKCPGYKVLIEDLLIPSGFLCVVLIAWAMDWTEVAIAKGYALTHFGSAIISLAVVRTKTPLKQARQIVPRYQPLKMLKFSLPLALTDALSKSTVGMVDVLILGVLASSYDVGVYRVASDMAVVMSVVLMAFSFMYFPMASEFAANCQHDRWQEVNTRVARWCMVLTFPIFSTLFLFPGEVLHIFYGAEYLDSSRALRILSLGYFGHAMVGFTSLNLVAAGMSWSQFIAYLAGFFVNLFGNYLLIPIYNLNGAAFASLLSLWTMNGISIVIMKNRLKLHPFSPFYFYSLAYLFLLALIGNTIIRAGNFSEIISVGIFIVICFSSILFLYRAGYLIDSTDWDIIRFLFGKLQPRNKYR